MAQSHVSIATYAVPERSLHGIRATQPEAARHLADDSFEEADNQVSPRFIGVGPDEIEATAS